MPNVLKNRFFEKRKTIIREKTLMGYQIFLFFPPIFIQLVDPKSCTKLNRKIASICHYNVLLSIWNVIMIFSTHLKKLFYKFVCFQRFKKGTNEPRKTQNLAKKSKSTNVGFLWQFHQQIFSVDPKVRRVIWKTGLASFLTLCRISLKKPSSECITDPKNVYIRKERYALWGKNVRSRFLLSGRQKFLRVL